VQKFSIATGFVFIAAVLFLPHRVAAQQSHPQVALATLSQQTQSGQQSNVPAEARQAEAAVERTVRRLRMGVTGGIALDPELIDVGVHAAFAPIFVPGLEFRPGVEIGAGELTTLFGINLDVLYRLPGSSPQTRWRPYIGGGQNFALSHETFDSDTVQIDDDTNRFDFSDTDFNSGFNFIAGARSRGGMFLEMRATAWGVSMVRLLAGFNF
jgi:hypothetical protein